MKKILSVSLLSLTFVVFPAIAASKNAAPRWFGYTDHIKITLNSDETGFQILKVEDLGDLTITPTGCVDGQSCSFNVSGGDRDTAAVTIGSDWQHYCQFFIEDGTFMRNPILYQNSNCVGGLSADSQITHDGGYYYHIHMQ